MKDPAMLIWNQNENFFFFEAISERNKQGKDFGITLTHIAKGESLSRYLQGFKKGEITLLKLKKIFEKVSQSIGELQLEYAQDQKVPYKDIKTDRHEDLHDDNVFFDDKSEKVTLIDNSKFSLEKNPQEDTINFISVITAQAIMEKVNGNIHVTIGYFEALKSFEEGYKSVFPLSSMPPYNFLFFENQDTRNLALTRLNIRPVMEHASGLLQWMCENHPTSQECPDS